MSLILTISQYLADVINGFKHSSTKVSNQTDMPFVELNIVPHNAIGGITRICTICFALWNYLLYHGNMWNDV